MNNQTSNNESLKAVMPIYIIYGVLAISILPFILSLCGVDFGTYSKPFPWSSVSEIKLHEKIDAMHYTLKGSFTHTILEWSAFCTAIFAVILSFIHFKIKGDITTPIIGVALFASGCMDAFHTLAADRLIEAVADNRNLIPFTWAICRIFHALIIITGVSLFLFRGVKKLQTGFSFILIISFVFGGIAYGIIQVCATKTHLPQTMFPDAIVHRPYDIGPLILFILAGIFLYPRFYRKAPSIFSYSLIISVIPESATQLYMAFGSTSLFDNYFNVAHFLKIIAYLVFFSGLAFDYVFTYKKEKRTVLALTKEIINRKKAQKTSKESKEYTGNIIHSMVDTLIVVRPDTKIKMVNMATLKLLGYREDELIGKSVNMIFAEEEFKRSGVEDLLKKGFISGVEKTYISKDGRKIPMLLSGSVMLDEQNNVLDIVCVASDITERKLTMETDIKRAIELGKAYSELKDAQVASLNMMEDLEMERSRLETEIGERKKLEKERQSIQLKMMQSSKLASLGEIATGIAHEINQPLTYINSFVFRLQEKLKNGSFEKDTVIDELKTSKTQIDRMTNIINHLRTFGRADDMEKQQVSIETILNNTLLLIGERMRLKNIVLEITFEPDLPRVIGSQTQLEQVFINLFQNAIDAVSTKTESAKMIVDISLSNDKSFVVIKVNDNGMGIEQKDMDKIFDPFFTTKGVGKGTGVGLSIIYGIIQEHNGTITCKSEVGIGSDFTITLPVSKINS